MTPLRERMLAELKLDIEDPEAKEVLDMAGNITGLKVLTTDNESVSSQMKADVDRYLRSSEMEELMRVKDGDQTVKFFVKEGKDDNHVKELLMFASGLKEVMKGQDIEINGQKRFKGAIEDKSPVVCRVEHHSGWAVENRTRSDVGIGQDGTIAIGKIDPNQAHSILILRSHKNAITCSVQRHCRAVLQARAVTDAAIGHVKCCTVAI